jgi:hypothetical protein
VAVVRRDDDKLTAGEDLPTRLGASHVRRGAATHIRAAARHLAGLVTHDEVEDQALRRAALLREDDLAAVRGALDDTARVAHSIHPARANDGHSAAGGRNVRLPTRIRNCAYSSMLGSAYGAPTAVKPVSCTLPCLRCGTWAFRAWACCWSSARRF